MKRPRKTKKQSEHVDVPDALAAYGERFMSMFDDYDEQAAKKPKQSTPVRKEPSEPSSSSLKCSDNSHDDSDGDSSGEREDSQHNRQARGAQAVPSTADSKLHDFLSGRKGNRGGRAAAAARQPTQEQLAAQQRQQEQQRLLERKLKKQFMSSKVDKIFNGVDPQQLAAAAGAEEVPQELTPEEFAAMKRDVAQLGASALDKRSAKAYKAAMWAKLGAAAEKRPRIPAKMGLGMAKKAKQREAVVLQEAIAAGMVKAKGRGKKQRAIKAKQRDKGLMEAGPGFKNGVLRLPKSALR